MSKRDVEIEYALQEIDFIKKYGVATKKQEKDWLLKQMTSIDGGFAQIILESNIFTTDELIERIYKAIDKNDYRPKNMSIMQLALTQDIDKINGDFNTFDNKFSLQEQKKKTPEQIRGLFRGAMFNLEMLSKQFTADWLRRLIKHKNLVDNVKKSDSKTIVQSYQELFNALTADFCEEYDCTIVSKVVTNWSQVPRKQGTSTGGCCQTLFALKVPKNISNEEKIKMNKDFIKSPSTHPNAYKISLVFINIAIIKKEYPDEKEFFYRMISAFVHEMHHALDNLHPEKSALGPQIHNADENTRVDADTDFQGYRDSATEISSYMIGDKIYDTLKSCNF